MIEIDKNDELYKYLTKLKVEDTDKLYLELANIGRYKNSDVRQYFASKFAPSSVYDVKENDLEQILDYYVDLKNIKSISETKLNNLLKEYKQTKSQELKQQIINSQLKDVMYMCLNYYTLHKDLNLQDLIQIANIGIIMAIDNYEVETKLPFKDFLIYYVGQEITKEFEEKNHG